MGVHQYRRKIKLLVGTPGGPALDLSQFRVQFVVLRGDFQTPNSLDVRIFNLADDTANRITGEFTQIELQAGYDGNFGRIFIGTIKQVRAGRIDQKDSYLDITAADGDRAYNYATVATSLAAGWRPDDALGIFLRGIAAAATGQPPPSDSNAIDDFMSYKPKLDDHGRVRGKVFYGMAKDELRDFAQMMGMSWSIQDGQLVLIPLRSAIPGPIPLITPTSGLIGVPEQTANGLSVQVLLNPEIKIGQAIKLDSTINRFRYALDLESQRFNLADSISSTKVNADGLYYVMSAEHAGDTRGADWYTYLTCLAIDAAVPLGQKVGILPEEAVVRINP